MRAKSRRPRVLICVHDRPGLGHLRQCLTVAQALGARFPGTSVLILSGTPVTEQFEFPDSVDFVRIPGFIRKRGGAFVTADPAEAGDLMALRESIIRETTAAFAPDLIIVDREPLGFQGELAATLSAAKDAGVRLVLTLRDVIDDPQRLVPDWQSKGAVPTLELIYDQVWILGPPSVFNPLAGFDLPPSVLRKLKFTGYPLRFDDTPAPSSAADGPREPFLLVTTGGGGGAEGLVDWVLSAYEHDRALPFPAVIVLGPFMAAGQRKRFRERAAATGRVRTFVFDPQVQRLMRAAAGIVATGSYSTFCEILACDKPALLIPRLRPDREQLIRAVRAEQLGLARMLADPFEARGERDPAVMAEALRALPHQQRPLVAARPGLLDGLEHIAELAAPVLGARA